MSLLNIYDNVRIDKNFAFNICDFRTYSKKDEALIKSLIIYMSLNFQKNLFGLVDIDPSHFSETMKIDRADLFRKHDDPLFFKVNKRSEKELIELEKKHGNMSKFRCWNTNLENALFILKYEKIINSYKTNSSTEERITLKEFAYIEELHLLFKKTGKTKKIIYQYKPTEEFEHSLRKFFFSAKLSTYLSLRSSNLEDWYLNLLNRIQAQKLKGTREIKYNIKTFAEILNISTRRLDNNEKGAFSDLKKKINSKFKKTFLPKIGKEIQGLELNWVNTSNSKVKNIAQVTWVISNKEDIKLEMNKVYEDVFFTELFKNLSVFYNDNYSSFEDNEQLKINGFIEWLFSWKDYDIKKGKYISVFADIKGKQIGIEKKSETFFGILSDIRLRNENNKLTHIAYKEPHFLLTNPINKEVKKFNHIKDAVYIIISKPKIFVDYS